MTADPVAAWHELLDAGHAAESAAWLDERQRARGLAFGDRPLCTVLRPRFVRRTTHDALRAACDTLLGAFDVIDRRARTDASFRAQFRLAAWEDELLGSPSLHVASPLSRLDAFIDPSSGVPRITEYNAETPAGAAYGDALMEIFLALPVMHRFAERWQVQPLPARHQVLGTLLETWHRFRGVRAVPRIAIVDWADVPTTSEFRLTQEYATAMGFSCVITTPDALSYEGGVLRDERGGTIDVIYKRVLIHELVGRHGTGHPMVRAVVDGAACMINPFHCKPLHKKASLAVLSDERNADGFSAVQREAIARHVPWTRVVEERRTVADGTVCDLLEYAMRNRDQLVLKPNDDYGGAGIVLGWEVDDAEWEAALRRALDEPYIVQRRIALPEEEFPAITPHGVAFDRRIVDTAPFCWHGRYMEGILTRISTSTLVNVTAGGGSTVPTFVVEPR